MASGMVEESWHDAETFARSALENEFPIATLLQNINGLY